MYILENSLNFLKKCFNIVGNLKKRKKKKVVRCGFFVIQLVFIKRKS